MIMKKLYLIFLTALSALVLSWFLPWLYSMLFPVGGSEPFVAYSPVGKCFIVTNNLGDGKSEIHVIAPDGSMGNLITKEERDSLLPQIYFTQLVAAEKLPDSIAGKEVSIPLFKHGQWVFSSHPRDLNKIMPETFLIMESMPERIDLEDPEEVFTLHGKVEFIKISDCSKNESRGKRFDDIFRARGFVYPLRSSSANITTRKPYDEGYLLADGEGKVFHLKMQGGRPYMNPISLPADEKAESVFIMENTDSRELGFVSCESGNFHVIERDGYKVTKLPVGEVNPRREKVSVMKNLFNWIVKISDDRQVRWYALDSDDYSLLGSYGMTGEPSLSQQVASYIFPFTLSFTDINDCYAKPRFKDFSAKALWLGAFLAVVVVAVMLRGRCSRLRITVAVIATLIGGVFIFVPVMIFRD